MLFVFASFGAQSQSFTFKVHKQLKDAETGYIYAVPPEMVPGFGYVNPCTYRSPMAGLPVSYKIVAVIPSNQLDRLMDTRFAMTVIESAARSFEKICPEARFYSMDGPPSDFNTNKLEVFVLLMKDGQAVRYSERHDSTFDAQYAVRALLVPSKAAGPSHWVLASDERAVNNRVIADAPERRRKAEQQERQPRFEAEQRERQSNRRPATQLAWGEWLIDLGGDEQSGSKTWAKLQTKNLDDACDVPKDPNLRAMVVITQDKIVGLGVDAIRQLMTDAASRARRLCPQTRSCQTHQTATFSNPLRPAPPSETVTNCTYNGNPNVRIFLVPPTYRLEAGDRHEPDPQPAFASAIVSSGKSVGQYSDNYLAQIRAQIAGAKEASENAKARLNARNDFMSRTRAITWANTEMLRTNPFPYKDKIVGVRTEFSRMASNTEAFFQDLFVTGVPSQAFTNSGQDVVVAVKILGLRAVKTPIGLDMTVPYGAYVGVHVCRQRNCGDFFDPN